MKTDDTAMAADENELTSADIPEDESFEEMSVSPEENEGEYEGIAREDSVPDDGNPAGYIYDKAELSDFSDGDEPETAPLYAQTAEESRLVSQKYLGPFGLGNDKRSLVLTVINFIFSAVWVIAYIVCIIYRSAAFGSVQIQMAAQNCPVYTATLTSPVFTVLLVMLYILPVICLAWAISLPLADRKHKLLCDKRILFTTLGLNVLMGIFAVADIAGANIMFS